MKEWEPLVPSAAVSQGCALCMSEALANSQFSLGF